MKNQVQLIAYADRLGGGGIARLQALLRGPLAGLFGGVHLLPFFDPIDGADAGFDPVDHTRVDARLGTWSDVEALARDVDLMADLVVNHMSTKAPQFLHFLEHGARSEFDGLFLSPRKVFAGGPTAEELRAIYRPRPGPPFTDFRLATGETSTLWTTFTPQQVDIDVEHPQGIAYLERVLGVLAAAGVRTVRLDAVGYAIKRAGTSCFMLPETLDFIDVFARRARAFGLSVLVEVHGHYRQQIDIAARVDWVYDFALPPLVLHALYFGTAAPLKRWLGIRPHNALTVLDTHDGIGVVDIGAQKLADGTTRPGLVPDDEIDRLVETIHARSRGESRSATGGAASNLDLYQVNCTFFDALGGDDRAYWVARAIQFFLPGVPQVYYVGLLAGHNDLALLERTGVGRDINRRRYTMHEIDEALQRPVVGHLMELIRLRNTHPAFGGRMRALAGDETVLDLEWRLDAHRASLRIDFASLDFELTYSGGAGRLAPAFAPQRLSDRSSHRG